MRSTEKMSLAEYQIVSLYFRFLDISKSNLYWHLGVERPTVTIRDLLDPWETMSSDDRLSCNTTHRNHS
jgi:hypothetical protein